MRRRALHALLAALLLLALPAASRAWEPTAPPDAEGPPWGGDRFQHVAVRIGLDMAAPVAGACGSAPAPWAPNYSEGWTAGPGGFADIGYFFCPGHGIFAGAHRFALPSVGAETVGSTAFEFGPVTGTSIYAGWAVLLPVSLETELWTCTVAPTTTGPVLFGRLALGIARLDALSLTETPVPAGGNLPWWEAQTAPYGSAALGFEFRPFRYVGVFAELAACAVVPAGGSDRPGAEDAGVLWMASLRLGASVLFL